MKKIKTTLLYLNVFSLIMYNNGPEMSPGREHVCQETWC